MEDTLKSPRKLTPERLAEIEHWREHNWPHPSISNEADEQEYSRVADLIDHIYFLEQATHPAAHPLH